MLREARHLVLGDQPAELVRGDPDEQNDYIAWLAFGLAVIGGALALT